jgi:DNA-binding MarR family transcriptional regulator
MNRARPQKNQRRTVQLSERDLEDARRLLQLLVDGPTGETVSLAQFPQEQSVSRCLPNEAAHRELANRRRRTQLLPEAVLGEAAWDILLVLYAEQQGQPLNIAGLSKRLGLSATSALRWLTYLQDKRLVVRRGRPSDHRSIFVELTPNAIEALDRYFSEMISRTT